MIANHTARRAEVLRATENGKVVSPSAAVELIAVGDTVATGGFVGIGFAETLALALEQRFMSSAGRSPHASRIGDLTLVFGSSQGDFESRGLNRLAKPGLVSRVIGGHWGAVPKLQKLAIANEIEAYNLPQGVVVQMMRDIAAGKPGHLSRVGIDTFADPRHGGGKLNACTTEDLVRLIEINNEECLLYKTFPIHVAILRGTTADLDGNITMEKEALTLEVLSMAMAAHNSGGVVLVQVERIAARGTLNPRDVKIPGILVDCVVLADDSSHHMQTFAEQYNPAYSGELRVPLVSLPPLSMGLRKIVARRAAFELKPLAVVNLGIGMPEGIAAVAAEEELIDHVTLTAEPGAIGGIPARGKSFGASSNCAAIIDQPYQFDFYDGGGIDQAFLGMAQVDQSGGVNVSKFNGRMPGAGGFINISQNAKSVIFIGAFTTGGLEIDIEEGQLRIVKEGSVRKFVKQIDHRSFSGKNAQKRAQPVLYVTERCVFRLSEQGLELIEVARGIDIDRDVLALMDFAPIVNDVKFMSDSIFSPNLIGLRNHFMPCRVS